MTGQDPSRLVVPASGAAPALQEMLQAARAELPTTAQLESLAARLDIPFDPGDGGPDGGGGGGGIAAGSAAGGAAKALGLAKVAAVTLLVGTAVVAGGTLLWPNAARQAEERPAAVEPPLPMPPVADVGSEPPSEPATPPPAPDAALSTSPAPRQPVPAVPAAAARRPEPEPTESPPDRSADLRLLQRAQDALPASPTRALAILREHAAAFPRSMLAQEREVLAVDALLRAGRRQAARRRAERFRSRWPRSSHLRRLDRLIGVAAEGDAAAND